MMGDYGAKGRFPTMKEWYDGYTFGNTEVYNPWSVINFMYDVCADIQAFPRPYWINTSSNDIIRELIARADLETKGQIELLLDGGRWISRCMRRSRMATFTVGGRTCGTSFISLGI